MKIEISWTKEYPKVPGYYFFKYFDVIGSVNLTQEDLAIQKVYPITSFLYSSEPVEIVNQIPEIVTRIIWKISGYNDHKPEFLVLGLQEFDELYNYINGCDSSKQIESGNVNYFMDLKIIRTDKDSFLEIC